MAGGLLALVQYGLYNSMPGMEGTRLMAVQKICALCARRPPHLALLAPHTPTCVMLPGAWDPEDCAWWSQRHGVHDHCSGHGPAGKHRVSINAAYGAWHVTVISSSLQVLAAALRLLPCVPAVLKQPITAGRLKQPITAGREIAVGLLLGMSWPTHTEFFPYWVNPRKPFQCWRRDWGRLLVLSINALSLVCVVLWTGACGDANQGCHRTADHWGAPCRCVKWQV